jgi:tRNA(Ile)-lysidine synthase
MNNSNNHIDYWVACSGGVDSVVLVRLFKSLNKNFGVLHCNFKLRGEASEKDEDFVRNLANEINVPIEVRVFNIQEYINENGGNTQLAARNLRYQWFEEIKRDANAQIVLGHHKDDQVETFLLQLRRGGKIKGLSSMTTYNNGYLRPLLNYTKEEIYSLARKNNWLWREDLSNKKPDYLRNFYRNDLIPVFEVENELKSQVVELVHDFQTILLFAEHYLSYRYDFSKDVHVSFEKWDEWPYWMKHLLISRSGVLPISVKEVNRLKKSHKGKYLKNKHKSIWNEGDYFLIKSSENDDLFSDYQILLCAKKDVVYKKGEVFIDIDKVKGKVSLRNWREGETFQPLGLNGQKKVSKFLRDKKVPSSKKESYPVIIDESDQVVGVCGMCPDESFKLDENSKWLYRIIKV